MITKEMLTRENVGEMFEVTAKLRETVDKQDEALADIRVLREFAIVEGLMDLVVQSMLEEVLIWQHKYMETKEADFLNRMEVVAQSTANYVAKNNLKGWESRVARFLGRIADYKKEYQKAAEFYQTAIDKVTSDVAFTKNPALAYEYRGFLIMDQIRLGEVEKGIVEAKKLYEDYFLTEEGLALRKSDYATWAIWRSGVLLNLCRAVIDLGLTDKYHSELREWLEKAEQDLRVPEGVTVWTDFSIRKKEVAELRKVLG